MLQTVGGSLDRALAALSTSGLRSGSPDLLTALQTIVRVDERRSVLPILRRSLQRLSQRDRDVVLEGIYELLRPCQMCQELSAGAPERKYFIAPDESAAKVRRQVVPGASSSQVVILGQALAEEGQRLSGYPYIGLDGTLIRSGLTLDRFLSMFGYTINPSTRERRYAYSADAVYCWPGRDPRSLAGDHLKPSAWQTNNCSRWLDLELALLSPRVLIVQGVVARKLITSETFAGRFKQSSGSTAYGRIGGLDLGSARADVYWIPHLSPRSRVPNKREVLARVADLIRRSLD